MLLVNNRTSNILTEEKYINRLYYLPVRILKPKRPLLALLADSTSLNTEATASTTLVESTSSTLVSSTFSSNTEEVTSSSIEEPTSSIEVQNPNNKTELIKTTSLVVSRVNPISLKTLHQRLGHINLKPLKVLIRDCSLEVKVDFNINHYLECLEAKMLQ